MATKKEDKRNKHLTPEDRSDIETGLNMGMTFKGIARKIGKDPTTVSYEVKHHRMIHKNGYSTDEQPCSALLKAPYVCNNCPMKSSAKCRHVRYLYRANVAQKEYKDLLTSSREGIPLNKVQFYIEDQIITDGLKRGQHIYHIMASQPGIRSSKSTVYRHFHAGYYSASVLDLPRAVKFKPRHKKPSLYVPPRVKIGRTWTDFSALLDEKQLNSYVELDTVIGREGGKVIMTIHFTEANFMAGLLLDNKTACEAAAKFSALKDKLRSNGFPINVVMPVMLTDNGGEFSDIFAFENHGPDKEASLFYCDPMCSSQKPQIEKNHTLFRDIVPKGSSFDDFTQETVDLIFSHVNAVKRAKYHGKSAYDMFLFYFSKDLADLFGIRFIPADEVCQSPALLRKITDRTEA